MRTDALIHSLTIGLGPAPRRAVPRLLTYGGCLGLGCALLMLLVAYGPSGELSPAFHSWAFWMKLTYTGSLVLTASLLCDRMARPGARFGWLALLPVVPMVVLAAIAVNAQRQLPQQARMVAWLGHSNWSCPTKIALLSLPVFAALRWAMRLAAPTRLRAAGAAAGFLSGAIAAFAYALFCSETSAAFVATWYALGILVPAAAGALCGNILMRWV